MTKRVIQDGDTLSKISAETGISIEDIAAANGITNINRIYAGDIIEIPDGNSTTSSPSTTPTTTPWTDNNYDPTKSASVSNALENKETADAAVAKHINSGFQASDDYNKANQNKVDADNAVKNYGDFSYSNQSELDAIMNNILNRKDFSYDLNGDALYQQYKDKFVQQGKMASADVMGQAAAMTGGYGNSYAASVGNQAYQASLQNLNDIVPELYQMAYDRYNQEGQDIRNNIAMLMADNEKYMSEYQLGYNKLKDALDLANTNYYGNTDIYNADRDTKNSLEQLAWENTFTKKDDERQDALLKMQQEEHDAKMKAYNTPVVDNIDDDVIDDGGNKPITPKQTGATTTFVATHATQYEYLQRGNHRTLSQFKSYIKGEIEKATHLTDEEVAYLVKHYGLT